MLTCEECGCLVDPDATEIHQEWHEKVVTFTNQSVANPNRTQINEPWPGIFVQDC